MFWIISIAILTLILIVIVMIYDYKEGACQSYIFEDGTIIEWDRFGNGCVVHPDNTKEVHIADSKNGLGPLYKFYIKEDSGE